MKKKFGSGLMLEMVLITALLTALLNAIFFNTGLLGASGIVFMLILLSSCANIRAGEVPLTLISGRHPLSRQRIVRFTGEEIISLNLPISPAE